MVVFYLQPQMFSAIGARCIFGCKKTCIPLGLSESNAPYKNISCYEQTVHSKTSVKICDIGDDVKDALKAFRFRKSQKNAALILKVDKEKQRICIDEQIEDIEIDQLQDCIPAHQPRYIVYSYRMEHQDGRISYPMCFIFYTPRDIQMELQVLYASMKLILQKEAELTRVYEVRELEELTEDWLKENLSR